MTTHLLRPGPISDLRTRCNRPLSKARKGDLLGTEDGLVFVDCAGCLRELLVETRIKASGLPDDAATRWRFGGDAGTSSYTIWSVMTGHPMPDRRVPDVPHDPNDFGRCHELLKLSPAWRERLGEVAARFPAWTALVAEWQALTELYLEELPTGRAPQLYDRIKGLTGDTVR